eukprot:scaffold257443_cov27-Tisochrysis_lutea.AAC.2
MCSPYSRSSSEPAFETTAQVAQLILGLTSGMERISFCRSSTGRAKAWWMLGSKHMPLAPSDV